MSLADKVVVAEELRGGTLYRGVASAIVYCLSMMAMVGAFLIVALTMSPAIKCVAVLAHLVKVAFTNCWFVAELSSGA